jgi:hypothetical protein
VVSFLHEVQDLKDIKPGLRHKTGLQNSNLTEHSGFNDGSEIMSKRNEPRRISPNLPYGALASKLTIEIADAARDHKHEVACEHVGSAVFNVRLGNVPADVVILFQQVKGGGLYFERLIFQEFIAEARIPQPIAPVKCFGEAAV